MMRCLAVLVALVALVVAEPPVRFRPRVTFGVQQQQQQRPNTRFARLEEAPPAQQQPAGYHYPKPTSAGYHYNKPDQAFPLPGEEIPPAVTTTEQSVPETTTTAQAEQPSTTESAETMTTTAVYEDYEDTTAALEPTGDSDTSAKLRRRPAAPSSALINRLQRQRLEEPTVTIDEQQQQLVRPVYLINLPESTLQQLVLLNNAQLAGLQLAPQPTAVYLSELDYIYNKK
uniref:DUF4794 domain-containing protein n=1 Tax=Anopheles dirus TaxID=7168 RepID=A0A182NCE6_9DIPT